MTEVQTLACGGGDPCAVAPVATKRSPAARFVCPPLTWAEEPAGGDAAGGDEPGSRGAPDGPDESWQGVCFSGVADGWDEARGMGYIEAEGNCRMGEGQTGRTFRCYYGALCGGRGGVLESGSRVTFQVQSVSCSIKALRNATVAVAVEGPGTLPWARVAPQQRTNQEWAEHLCRIAWWVGATGDACRPPQPAEVSPGLFLGGLSEAKDVASLESSGIDCVLCMAPDMCGNSVGRGYPERFQVLDIDSRDAVDYDLFSDDLPQALRFVEKCLGQGRSVLVHCFKGINRSAAVCAAWMLQQRLPLGDIVRRMAGSRGVVLQNEAFLEGLAAMARDRGLLSDSDSCEAA